jgi:hypothetical protein
MLGMANTYGLGQSSRRCAPAETRRARSEISKVSEWAGFYQSFESFKQCDTGQVSVEFSYALSRLLARRWLALDTLLDFTGNDDAFKRFILRHLDENIPEEEAQVIITNARQHCPVNGGWLCKAIVDY